MPSGGHNKLLKSFNQERIVECGKCGQHMCAKQMKDHWKTYKNGGRGYPRHQSNSMTVKYYELENGKAIKTKSIFAMLW